VPDVFAAILCLKIVAEENFPGRMDSEMWAKAFCLPFGFKKGLGMHVIWGGNHTAGIAWGSLVSTWSQPVSP